MKENKNEILKMLKEYKMMYVPGLCYAVSHPIFAERTKKMLRVIHV